MITNYFWEETAMIAALMIAASVLFTGTVATPASFGSASRRLEPAHHKSPCIGECALRSSALAATLALTSIDHPSH